MMKTGFRGQGAGKAHICRVKSHLHYTHDAGRTTSYYHPDHLGSSNIITDENGEQIAYYEYTPYGTLARGTIDEGRGTNYLFTGKELDRTGLYFYGARYYDAEIGRFITADPTIQHPYDPQDLNRYAYCRNNPINYTDPSGLGWFKKFWQSITGIASTIASIIFPPLAPVMWALNLGISAYTAIDTGNIAGFVGGIVGGAVFGAIGKSFANSIGASLGGSAFSFGGGALIGAVEFGAGGFGAGFGGALASGASFSDALQSGGKGAAFGAATGAVIEGSYMAGWQDAVHGLSRENIYEAGIKRLHNRYANAADTTAIVGSRPIDNLPAGRHKYIRGRAGRFEMGHNKSGEIEINGRALHATNKFLNNPISQLSETTVAVNQVGFNRAVGYYRAAWEGSTYRGYSHNSNYAVDTVIYGAGSSPTSDIRAPGFDW